MIRSNKIKKSARDQDCSLRLIGVCNYNTETTVLAHIGRDRGMGIKCHDYFAVYACSSCHDEIDRRTRHLDEAELPADKLRALEETWSQLFDLGLLIAK